MNKTRVLYSGEPHTREKCCSRDHFCLGKKKKKEEEEEEEKTEISANQIERRYISNIALCHFTF